MDNILREKQTRPAFVKICVLILLVISGVIINFLGSAVATIAGLPFYLDIIGTLLASMLGGYIPGILVGLISPIITSLTVDPMAISYAMLNVMIAAITSWMYEHNIMAKLRGVILAIILDAIVGGILGGIVTWFIYGFGSEDSSSGIVNIIYTKLGASKFMAEILGGFIVDLGDKTISIIIAIIIMNVLPQKIRKMFKIHAWRQAPLTTEVLKELRKSKSRQVSLRIKMVSLMAVAAVVIGVSAIFICYRMYYSSNVEHQQEFTKGLARTAASVVDGDRIDEYIRMEKTDPEYKKVLGYLTSIRESTDNVDYVYVYKILEDGCHVVFDVDTEDTPGGDPGTIVEFDESFMEYVPTLLAGGRIDPIESNDRFGWLYTVYEPITDSSGKTVAYAGVDASMNHLRFESRQYMIRVISAFLGIFAFTLALGLYLLEYQVVLPLKTMAYTASLYSSNKHIDLHKTADLFHRLHIDTGDETENLYNAFSEMTDDNLEYLTDIRKKNEIISQMQDSLILVLADMVESRDKNTGNHVKKTSEYVKIIMDEIVAEGIYADQLTEKFKSDVYRSAPLHDIGKISVSDVILNKNGKLTDEEFALMKGHTTAGAEILDRVMATVPGSDEGYLHEARIMALYHHEKWNGMGYPTGLSGEEIPLSARIMAVADVFDALVSTRSYKKGFPFEKAIGIIEESSGSHFDPMVAKAFLNAKDKAHEVMDKSYNQSSEI
ncbi:MAG: HD domain-containing protein [Butyrivibrio sp.]|nr:HD domain-containing protein [Butyrivibrio sp.]